MISFFIANIFLAYLIGSDNLILYLIDGVLYLLGSIVRLLIFT